MGSSRGRAGGFPSSSPNPPRANRERLRSSGCTPRRPGVCPRSTNNEQSLHRPRSSARPTDRARHLSMEHLPPIANRRRRHSSRASHATDIMSAFSVSVGAAPLARRVKPSGAAASSRRGVAARCASASDDAHTTRSAVPAMGRRAFAAGAALLAGAVDASSNPALAFERPPPGAWCFAPSRSSRRSPRRPDVPRDKISRDRLARVAPRHRPRPRALPADHALRSRAILVSSLSQATVPSTTPSTGTSCSAPTTGSRSRAAATTSSSAIPRRRRRTSSSPSPPPPPPSSPPPAISAPPRRRRRRFSSRPSPSSCPPASAFAASPP